MTIAKGGPLRDRETPAVVRWTGRVCLVVGGFLFLVWIRTLVKDVPPRPMPVDGLGAFWLGTSAVLLLGLGWAVRSADRAGTARGLGRPLAGMVGLMGIHRVVSGVLAGEVRDWMGAFVVPEGVVLGVVAVALWRAGSAPTAGDQPTSRSGSG